MNRETEVQLLRDALGLMQAGAHSMAASEVEQPVSDYTDPIRFNTELEVMARSLNVVAHASQVPEPGSFITREIVGRPVLITRGLDGTVRAFLNVCRHRGARVETRESGRCRAFVCPYHAWTYRTDGTLASVRQPEGFPSVDFGTAGLVPLPCVESAELIWVNPSGEGEQELPTSTVAVLAELEGLGCVNSIVQHSDSKVWRANWKLIADGGLESYHFKIAHRRSIAPLFPDNVSIQEFLGRNVRTVLPTSTMPELLNRPESDWRIRDYTHVVYALWPNATVLVQEGHYTLATIQPVAIDQTEISVATVVPRARSEQDQAYWRANHDFTMKTLDEDFVIGEQIQAGMATGANTTFRFGLFEGALGRWHEMLREEVAGHLDLRRSTRSSPTATAPSHSFE